MSRKQYAFAAVALMAIAALGGISSFHRPSIFGRLFTRASNDVGLRAFCSSQLAASGNENFSCANALPNTAGEWASNGEKAGAWIELAFGQEADLKAVRLYDRGNADETVMDGHFEVSNGKRFPVELDRGIASLADPKLPNARVVFDPVVRTRRVRFVVDRVSDKTTSAGLSEIAPEFTIVEDSPFVEPILPIDQKREGVIAAPSEVQLLGSIGVARNDSDGTKKLMKVSSSTIADFIVPGEGAFFIAAASAPTSHANSWPGYSASPGLGKFYYTPADTVAGSRDASIDFRGVPVVRLDSCDTQRSAVLKTVSIPPSARYLQFRANGTWAPGKVPRDGGMRVRVGSTPVWRSVFWGGDGINVSVDISAFAGKTLPILFESFASSEKGGSICDGEFVHFYNNPCFVADQSDKCGFYDPNPTPLPPPPSPPPPPVEPPLVIAVPSSCSTDNDRASYFVKVEGFDVSAQPVVAGMSTPVRIRLRNIAEIAETVIIVMQWEDGRQELIGSPLGEIIKGREYKDVTVRHSFVKGVSDSVSIQFSATDTGRTARSATLSCTVAVKAAPPPLPIDPAKPLVIAKGETTSVGLVFDAVRSVSGVSLEIMRNVQATPVRLWSASENEVYTEVPKTAYTLTDTPRSFAVRFVTPILAHSIKFQVAVDSQSDNDVTINDLLHSITAVGPKR